MTIFPAYAGNFNMYPGDGEAYLHLAPLLDNIKRINFVLSVADPKVNQGQMVSTFDAELEKSIIALGASSINFKLPEPIPQELDFAFSFDGKKVAVEIEKANREKILRDFLKCHMYLHSGADFTLVVLLKNYPHKHGVWNLFEFGVQRYKECLAYGFGTPESLGRILILGFDQFDGKTGELLSSRTRERMRKQALSQTGRV